MCILVLREYTSMYNQLTAGLGISPWPDLQNMILLTCCELITDTLFGKSLFIKPPIVLADWCRFLSIAIV